MSLLKKVSKKLRLHKPKYHAIQVRTPDFVSYKILAAEEKKNLVDFFHELLDVYIGCKKNKHVAIIKDLLLKQDALVDTVKLYRKRWGKIYVSPAANTTKAPSSSDLK